MRAARPILCAYCRDPMRPDECMFELKPVIGKICERCQRYAKIGVGAPPPDTMTARGTIKKRNRKMPTPHAWWVGKKQKGRK